MRAFYDFSVSPFSYDFLSFLLAATAAGANEIVLVPGKRMMRGGDGKIVEFQKCSPAEQAFRLKNLIKGLCPEAIVCSSREEAKALWHEDCFPKGYTVEKPVPAHIPTQLFRTGGFAQLMPNEEMAKAVAEDWPQKNLAVITVRQCRIKPERNSNIPEWIKAADWMAENGFSPVFIPDTDFQEEVFGKHPSCVIASTNVQYRLALYQSAYLNLGINNGPCVMNIFSNRPMLYFRPIIDGFVECSTSFWRAMGLTPGNQPKWFTEKQRIVWEGMDDFRNIKRSVIKWMESDNWAGKWLERRA